MAGVVLVSLVLIAFGVQYLTSHRPIWLGHLGRVHLVHVLINAVPDLAGYFLALAGVGFALPKVQSYLNTHKRVSIGSGLVLALIAILAVLLNAVNRSNQEDEQNTRDQEQTQVLTSVNDIEKSLTSTKAMTEAQRKERISEALRDEYIITHNPIDPGILSGAKTPPAAWMNERLRELGENWSVSDGLRQGAPQITSSVPSNGNLNERLTELSREIRGYWGSQELRTKGVVGDNRAREAFEKSTSSWFRFHYEPKVIAIRDECANLHYVDPALNEILDQESRSIQIEASAHREDPIDLITIQEIARRLSVLAKQIPDWRASPKSLRFSATQVQSDNRYLPFELLITIDADVVLSSGFVVVEFDGTPTFGGDDLVGGNLVVFGNDQEIEGDAALQEYLSARPLSAYAVEVGTTPFTPDRPIHVHAYDKKPFDVRNVLFFN
jgi:hypothetical protein